MRDDLSERLSAAQMAQARMIIERSGASVIPVGSEGRKCERCRGEGRALSPEARPGCLGVCPDCQGTGERRDTYPSGRVSNMVFACGHCQGTGHEPVGSVTREAINGLLRVIDGRVSETDARTDIAFARSVAQGTGHERVIPERVLREWPEFDRLAAWLEGRPEILLRPERVIPAADAEELRERARELTRTAMRLNGELKLLKSNSVLATDLRAWIEASEALPPVPGRSVEFNEGKALALRAVRAWLDEQAGEGPQ